jgi:membrane associated rhomboid family serine protease
VRRNPYGNVSYTFGPGGISNAVKWLIIANVVVFLACAVVPRLTIFLGLTPAAIVSEFWLWQAATYMFVHRELFHLLFNMLALWMFGTELERMWGQTRFLKFYAICGVGAAVTTILASLLPFAFASPIYYSMTIGASGAVYGLLLAWAMLFPDRPILMFMLFPVPAKVFVLVMGAISLWLSVTSSGGGVAHITHLGGLVAGYLYLSSGHGGITAEIKYRYLKWKMGRMRRKFDVVPGGKRPGSGGGGGWDGRVH